MRVDVVLLQEACWLDSDLTDAIHHEGFSIIEDETEEKRGLLCLVSERLTVSKQYRADSGAMAVVIASGKDRHHTLVVNARAPPGIDTLPEGESTREEIRAKQLRVSSMYEEIGRWMAENKKSRVVVGIDANETRSTLDRSSLKAKEEARYLGVFIDTHDLVDNGEDDHAHTYGRGGTTSRIDYILSTLKGDSFTVLANPSEHDDHKMLLMDLGHTTHNETPSDIRPAEVLHDESMPRITHIDTSSIPEKKSRGMTEEVIAYIRHANVGKEDAKTEDLVDRFNRNVRQIVTRSLDLKEKNDKRKPAQTAAEKKLLTEVPRKMRAITRLNRYVRKILERPPSTRPPAWRTDKGLSLIKNVKSLGLSNISKPAERWELSDLIEWYKDVPSFKASIHRRKQEVRKLCTQHDSLKDLFTKDRSRFYKKIFDKESREMKELKHGTEYVRGDKAVNIIEESISSSFSQKRQEPDKKPSWVKDMYQRRTELIDLFQPLSNNVTIQEVRSAILGTGNGKSGLDYITNDVLKCMIKMEEKWYQSGVILEHVTYILNRFMTEGSLPANLRRVVMKMIPKSGAIELDVSMLRPISIIPELCKLIGKILATRLGGLLCSRPDVLHPSQRGFLRHGNTTQCIDVTMRVLEDNRWRRGNLHIASYDQRKAYDSVQHFSIRMALAHFGLPDKVANLIMSSLTGSTAHLSTEFGKSQPFPLLTSVKQGDPLAPLIFILTVDPLHRGLDRNPLYGGARDGYMIGEEIQATVSSTAYADDFTVASKSWNGLQRLHDWVIAFFRFHHLDLNPKKSFFTCKDENKVDSKTGTIKSLPPVFGSEPIPWKSQHEAWRHLGVQMTLDLDWSTQVKTMNMAVGRYIHVSGINRLNAVMRATTIRECIISRLDGGLAHANIEDEKLCEWNRRLRHSVLENSHVRGIGSFSVAAFHLITNIPCLKHQMAARRLSELQIQLNSREPPSSEALWALLASRARSADLETIIDKVPAMRCGQDWLSSAQKAMRLLNASPFYNNEPWYELDLRMETIDGAERLREWQRVHESPCADKTELMRTRVPSSSVWEAFTDGSTPVAGGGPSGIGVYLTHPNYREVRVAQPFKASGNNYAAELMAILTALVLVPVNHPLKIYTDSQASILAIERDKSPRSEREWIRTAARPIARTIHIVLKNRTAQTSFVWVRSHSGDESHESKGNREADILANEGRRMGEQEPQRVKDFTHNEERMVMYIRQTRIRERQQEQEVPPLTHVIGDVRQEAKRESTRQFLRKWIEQPSQGLIAATNPIDTLELCRYIRSTQNNTLLCCYLETLTQTGDTAQRRRRIYGDNEKYKHKRMDTPEMNSCPFCRKEDETTEHIYLCDRVRTIYRKDFDRITYEMDPHELLEGEFQWVTPRKNSTSMVETWKSLLKDIHYDDKENRIMDMVRTLNDFKPLAGVVGVQPPKIRDVYLAYEEIALMYHKVEMTDKQKDTWIKHIQNVIDRRLKKIRYLCVQLTLRIWKRWRTLLERKTLAYEIENAQEIKVSSSKTMKNTRKKKIVTKKPLHKTKQVRTTGPRGTRKKMWDNWSQTWVPLIRRRKR